MLLFNTLKNMIGKMKLSEENLKRKSDLKFKKSNTCDVIMQTGIIF